ncbi:MAG: transporter, family, tetracycline resistance protein [Patescibacteria group bacterium]|nr:transporter, family, tetracycline resistance protein [Patescibacteria group bacterium]
MASSNNLTRKALPIVIFTVFLDVLGVGILIPVLPQMVFKIFIPAGFSYNESLIALGWLTGIYPLMQFVATPILGQLSDRYGRKRILSLSLAGTGFGYVLFAIGIITKNIPLLFISRAFDGVTGGNISVARAVIADVTKPEDRTKNFGLIGAAFGIGFVMGPYLGARLASPNVNFFGLFTTPSWFNAATPFWFTAILAAINTILVLAILPETHQHINKKLKMVWNQSLTNIRKAASAPGLRIVFTAEFLYQAGFTFFTTFFQILLIQKLNFTQANVGDFFAYIGIWIAVTQGVITPILAKRFKNYQVLRVTFFGMGLALFAQLWPSNTSQLLLISPLIAVFVGVTMANISALVSLSAGPEMQGEILGIDASVMALAQAIPAIISGYVATMGMNMPVIVGAITVMAAGVIFAVFYKPSNHILHESPAELAAEAAGGAH